MVVARAFVIDSNVPIIDVFIVVHFTNSNNYYLIFYPVDCVIFGLVQSLSKHDKISTNNFIVVNIRHPLDLKCLKIRLPI